VLKMTGSTTPNSRIERLRLSYSRSPGLRSLRGLYGAGASSATGMSTRFTRGVAPAAILDHRLA